MDWLFSCFSCKSTNKSTKQEQEVSTCISVHSSSPKGSRADDLRHKIPLQRFFPESENVVKETSAGQSLQGRKWEEALYDLNKNIGREISNDRALNFHDFEKPHTLRILFNDLHKASETNVVEGQDSAFMHNYLRRFDIDGGSLVDSCMRDNVNNGPQVDLIEYLKDQSNLKYGRSTTLISLGDRPSSKKVPNKETDTQKTFATISSISKSSGLQSSLNVIDDILSTQQDDVSLSVITSNSNEDIERDTESTKSYRDGSSFNGEKTKCVSAKNDVFKDGALTTLKHEKVIRKALFSSQLGANLDFLSDVTHGQPPLEQMFNSPSKSTECKEHLTPSRGNLDSSEFSTPNTLSESLSPPTSVHSEHSESSCFTETMSNEQMCSTSSSSSSQVETPKSVQSSISIEDRPILGTVAAHWNNTSPSAQKWWDGKGIPNSTNKYKEDQKVSWHATPFEVRLERALSKQKRTFQKKLFEGPVATNRQSCPFGSST